MWSRSVSCSMIWTPNFSATLKFISFRREEISLVSTFSHPHPHGWGLPGGKVKTLMLLTICQRVIRVPHVVFQIPAPSPKLFLEILHNLQGSPGRHDPQLLFPWCSTILAITPSKIARRTVAAKIANPGPALNAACAAPVSATTRSGIIHLKQ